MFANACAQISEAIYGVVGLSQINPTQANFTNGTGFMIAPGVLMTAAHLCHIESNPGKPVHQKFEAIRSPDIGQGPENATFLAEDAGKDIALLRISAPRSNACVTFETARIPSGTPVGSLGFPLASIVLSQAGRGFNLRERFQAAHISAYGPASLASGAQAMVYETDSFMYPGSSGCPAFLDNGRVFGMHISSVVQETAGKNADRVAIANWIPAADMRDVGRANGLQLA